MALSVLSTPYAAGDHEGRPYNVRQDERRRTSTVKHIALILIRIYQNTLSVILPSSCRFTPSCSHYGYEAISHFGFFRGGWMTIKRIGRCQPFYQANLYTPSPERLADYIHKAR